MASNKKFDVVVIGAGVGGLTAATLLAKDGLKVLVLEQCDRVGGRALSIEGKEISDKGLKWYQNLLATQYTYLADSQPNINDIIVKRMLDGYILDVGYHAISCNSRGYMLDFENLIGGITELRRNGCHYGTWYKGEFNLDLFAGNMNTKYAEVAQKELPKYLYYYTSPFKLTDEEIDKLEKVSLQEWAEKYGITKNDFLWNNLRTVSTLFTTINNPNDISIGEIFRYSKKAMLPKIVKGIIEHVGGFIENGVMEWSKAVVKRFKSLGGEILLDTRVKEVKVSGGKVTGVVAVDKNGTISEFDCDNVVSNIPAQDTFKVVDKNHFPKAWAEKTESMYGYGSYSPYIGLNKLVMPKDQAQCGIKNDCVLPKEEGFDWDVYICWNIQSVTEPSVAPEGKYLYTAYLPITEKEAKNKELVGKLIKRLPDFMEEIYPGFKESIDWKLDLVCWKLEGVAKSISQAGTQKVPVKSEYVKGLYFAGDTAKGYGVAMDCAIAAGMLCAGEFLGKDFGVE